MKNLIAIIILLSFLSLTVNKEDQKKLDKVSKLINKSTNYFAAKSILLTISEEAINDENYLQLSAIVFDSCKDYNEAIKSYSGLMKIHPEKTELAARIDELKKLENIRAEKERIRLEKIKACTKCNCTDKIKLITTCEVCYGKGEALISCMKCRGVGRVKCESCNGSGLIKLDQYSTPDPACGGLGTLQCPDQCSKGQVLGTCKTCRGKGTVETTQKCDMHE